ncbi:MAG TPA: prolyl oligopeptidase family serine peptidase [Tepidisphaeraceae bacterium]|nr:prolyl oligopeptidase family serine peptidase [Tepidisphaeraceae bacterium]
MLLPRFARLALAFACLTMSARAAAPHPSELIRADSSLFATPKSTPAEGFTPVDARIRAVWIDAKPLAGKPTRAFAWIGLPKIEPGKKIPGMVLVHGGGGTAFDTWVKLWVDRGYAAIVVDTCGQVPKGTYGKWERNPQGGPPGWGGFDQADAKIEDQWPYHAVTAAVLSHSLLRAQVGVDPDRIGLTGISWGGYLTCLISGVDNRFKLAAPVYGCGFIDECTWSKKLTDMGDKGKLWLANWDPRYWLPASNLPTLWVTGTNDFAYPMGALQKSYRLPTGERTLCVRLRMKHGHGAAGEAPAEIAAFADAILKTGDAKGPGLPKVTGQGADKTPAGEVAWATFTSRTAVAKAELLYTPDAGPWQKRTWVAIPATVGDDYRVTAKVPAAAKVYYLNLIDEHGNVVSTEHVGD